MKPEKFRLSSPSLRVKFAIRRRRLAVQRATSYERQNYTVGIFFLCFALSDPHFSRIRLFSRFVLFESGRRTVSWTTLEKKCLVRDGSYYTISLHTWAHVHNHFLIGSLCRQLNWRPSCVLGGRNEMVRILGNEISRIISDVTRVLWIIRTYEVARGLAKLNSVEDH